MKIISFNADIEFYPQASYNKIKKVLHPLLVAGRTVDLNNKKQVCN